MSSTNFYLLFESSSGFSLFQVLENEEIGNLTVEVQISMMDFSKFQKMVKMIGFHPFDTAENALENMNAITEHELTDELKTFLESNIPKGKKSTKFPLGVLDSSLAMAIQDVLSIPCRSDETIKELIRGVRFHFTKFVKPLANGLLEQSQLGLGHAYSRSKVKFNPSRADNMIIQSIALLDQMDKDINTFAMRVREWYSWHFPELKEIVKDNFAYARCAAFIKDKSKLSESHSEGLMEILEDEGMVHSVLKAAKTSMGMDTSEQDMSNIIIFTERMISLALYRKQLYSYLEEKMATVAPNLSSLIGETVAARLIQKAGSLTQLAKCPASTVQILGAEKALFRALKTKGNTPKYGLIYHSSFIGRASAKNKGRISRYLANKCSIAARVDSFIDEPTNAYGVQLRDQVEERLRFYDTGEMPRKNIDVMSAVAESLRSIAATAQAEAKKNSKKSDKKEKKKRPLNEVVEVVAESNETETTEKKKKKKKKSIEAAVVVEEELPTKKKKKLSLKMDNDDLKLTPEEEAQLQAVDANEEQPDMKDGGDRHKSFGIVQNHLAVQDLSTLDPTTLTPLTPEVISRQATINIGTIGHVAHGKSTVVKAISGVQTVRFKNELIRNITIKLGYANAKIYRCDGPRDQPGNYRSKGSSQADEFEEDGKLWKLQRHVSFVDCPGHDILMATMLNGAAVMDAALLLVAGNEPCPQPQTSEHLAAVEIMRLQNIIILQNKVDLVKPDVAEKQYEQIKNFVAGTVADSAPIIPISAVLRYNIDVVCEYISRHLPVPVRNFTSVPRLIVIRSFDVNKPGEDVQSLRGGVAGGSILQGVLRVGDEIEVRPGIVSQEPNQPLTCTAIFSRIVTLYAEKNDLQYAVPGGLIGVGTKIDPTLTRADRLVGQVLGLRGQLPEVFSEVQISYYLLRRLLGVKTQEGSKQAKVSRLTKGEMLMVNIGSTSTGGKVVKVMEGAHGEPVARISLSRPVCTQENEKIALSRRVDKHWRLIGWGEIIKGTKIDMDQPVQTGYDESQDT